MGEPEKTPDRHIDSCKYAVDLSKQFITLASGGLAFMAGLALSSGARCSLCMAIAAFVCFAVSILLGLLFVMKAVGLISKESNYDVYTKSLRIVAALQIAAFLAGALLLGIQTISLCGNKASAPTQSNIEINIPCRPQNESGAGGVSVRIGLPVNCTINVFVDTPAETNGHKHGKPGEVEPNARKGASL